MADDIAVGGRVLLHGADELIEFFETRAALVATEMRPLVRTWGYALQREVQANASGRPGPNVITGEYRASIDVTFAGSNQYVAQATVGTDAPQGRRLEYGFVGTDSLGRHYQQPPFPHFGPAFDMIEPLFSADAVRRIDIIMDGR